MEKGEAAGIPPLNGGINGMKKRGNSPVLTMEKGGKKMANFRARSFLVKRGGRNWEERLIPNHGRSTKGDGASHKKLKEKETQGPGHLISRRKKKKNSRRRLKL